MRRSLPHQTVVSIDFAVGRQQSRKSQETAKSSWSACGWHCRDRPGDNRRRCMGSARASRYESFGILIIIFDSDDLLGRTLSPPTVACAWRCQVPCHPAAPNKRDSPPVCLACVMSCHVAKRAFHRYFEPSIHMSIILSPELTAPPMKLQSLRFPVGGLHVQNIDQIHCLPKHAR